MELILNQYKSSLVSCVRFSNIVFKFAPQEYKVLSSAKLKIVDFPMTKRKSFKNICKHSGISIKWTLYKVDISLRLTVDTGTEGIYSQTFMKKSLYSRQL